MVTPWRFAQPAHRVMSAVVETMRSPKVPIVRKNSLMVSFSAVAAPQGLEF